LVTIANYPYRFFVGKLRSFFKLDIESSTIRS
jgi:hypothetical protein